jgi:hypothetical protein
VGPCPHLVVFHISCLLGNAADVSHGAVSRPSPVTGSRSPTNSRAPFQLFTFDALGHSSCRDQLTATQAGRFSSSGGAAKLREKLRAGPGLSHFIARSQDNAQGQTERALLPPLGADIGSPSSFLKLEPSPEQDLSGESVLGSEEAGQRNRGKVYFETFGCQVSDRIQLRSVLCFRVYHVVCASTNSQMHHHELILTRDEL